MSKVKRSPNNVDTKPFSIIPVPKPSPVVDSSSDYSHVRALSPIDANVAAKDLLAAERKKLFSVNGWHIWLIEECLFLNSKHRYSKQPLFGLSRNVSKASHVDPRASSTPQDLLLASSEVCSMVTHRGDFHILRRKTQST